MRDTDDSDDQPNLTPPDIDHTHLPDQTMYKVDLSDADSFTQDRSEVTTYPLVVTNGFKILYFEIESGGRIDWHTHTPGFEEICMCLNGRAQYTLEQEDGNYQTLEIGPREFVYVPGGARHKIEAVSQQHHEGLVAMPSEPLGRLELLEGASPYSEDEWPIALWVDCRRDEVVTKDEEAVST